VISLVVLLHGEEVLVRHNFSQHDVLVILVKSIFFALLPAVAVLHILETLSLEENVKLVVLDLHNVRTLAVD
jgi:hypothetical protein